MWVVSGRAHRTRVAGSRTLTVFAPMDEAFRTRRSPGNFSNSGSIVDRLFQDDYTGGGRYKKQLNSQRIADRFVLSHVVLAGVGDPPMYTAGLRFYQVRDTAYRLRGVSSAGDSAATSNDDDTIVDDDGDDGKLTLQQQLVDGEKPRYYQLTVYKDSGEIFKLNLCTYCVHPDFKEMF